MKKCFIAALLASALSSHAYAQSAPTMVQWGLDKSAGYPYGLKVNLSGTWVSLGTISSAGAFKPNGVTISDVSGLMSGSYVAPSVMPAFSGDVTTIAGTTTATIAPNAVSNSKMATMPAATIKGNNGVSSSTPIDLTPAQARATLELSPLATATTVNLATQVSGTLQASYIEFTRTGTGAVPRNMLAWIEKQPISPLDYGALCNSNGTTGNGADDTAAYQAAIDASQTYGRRLEHPHAAICRVTSQLTNTTGIIWSGHGVHNTPNAFGTPDPLGSWIYADHTGVAIYAGSTSTVLTVLPTIIQDIGILRNQPAFVSSGSWSPTANDFDILAMSADLNLRGVWLWNPTKGVQVTSASGSSRARLSMHDVRMAPYTIGLDLDRVYDFTYLSNVRIYPFDGGNPYTPVADYRHANLVAIRSAKADNLESSNVTIFGAKWALQYSKNTTSSGAGEAGISVGHVWNGLQVDSSLHCVHVDDNSAAILPIEVKLVGPFCNGTQTKITGSQAIYTGTNSASRITIVEPIFHYFNDSVMQLDGNGFVQQFGGRVNGYNYNASGAPYARIGNANANLYLYGRLINESPNGTTPFMSGAGYTAGAAQYDVGINDRIAVTAAAAFATPGDSSPSASVAGAYYVREGRVFYDFTITLTTGAYTTAAGALSLTTNLPAPKYAPAALHLGAFSNITYGAGVVLNPQLTGGKVINIMASTTNAAAATTGTGYFPASKTITMPFYGSYQAY